MAISNTSSGFRPGVCTSTTRPTAPFNGQVIYETDTKQTLVWQGSVWVMLTDADQPPGLQLVGTFTANGTSRALLCDNIFTAEYENYELVINLGSTSTFNYLYSNLLDSAGNQLTTNYYFSSYGKDYASGTTGYTVVPSTSYLGCGHIASLVDNASAVHLKIYRPYDATRRTAANGQFTGIRSGSAYQGGEIYMMRIANEINRGIRFDNVIGTNLTGTVRVYGYRN